MAGERTLVRRMMTSKERVLAAVKHQVADRVPITFDAEVEVYAALNQHLGTQSKEELFDRLHVDTWMLLPGNFIYPQDQEGQPEKTAIWGYRTRTTQYQGGAYDELCFSPLVGKDDIGDIDAHPWPALDTLDFSHFPAEAAAHRNRAIIGVFTWGAFHIACLVRGMEELLSDFAIRKRYAHHLIHTIGERVQSFLDHMLEGYGAGIDIVYMCDDYCSQQGPLFSPDMFKEFVVPYLTPLVERVHKHGKKFLLHVCGSVRELLPMVVEAGVDMLEPIQIRAQGMDPEGLKRDFGKHLCFYGGVDLQETLPRGSSDRVRDEVKRLIDVLGREGGYILGPGHTYIQPDTPLENIMVMYETAFRYRPWCDKM
jgi:uroporphyrinogen decarboxylase